MYTTVVNIETVTVNRAHGRWNSSRRTSVDTDRHYCDIRRSRLCIENAADTAFPENLSALHVTYVNTHNFRTTNSSHQHQSAVA